MKLWVTSRKVKGGRIHSWRRGRTVLLSTFALDDSFFLNQTPVHDDAGKTWFMVSDPGGPRFSSSPSVFYRWWES